MRNFSAAAVLVAAAFGPAAMGGTIQSLGVIAPRTASSCVAISSDGTIAAGESYGSSGVGIGFRWTNGGGAAAIDLLPGYHTSGPNDMSADGSVVVGQAACVTTPTAYTAFRWTAAGGTESLGYLPGHVYSNAYAVSGDGSVIVGQSSNSSTLAHAAVWTSAGVFEIPALPGPAGTTATAVNYDGSVIVGVSQYSVFRWTAATGTVNIIPGATNNTRSAAAISSDGSVVTGNPLFRWTEANGVEYLPSLYGTPLTNSPRGNDLTADGSRIVGQSYSPLGGFRALMWTEKMGTVDLNSYLPLNGINTSGWLLVNATSISDDGTIIAGTGKFNGADRGWIVTGLPSTCVADFNGSRSVSVDDIFAYLNQWFAGNLSTDVDATPGVGIGDIFFFLNSWFAGCP